MRIGVVIERAHESDWRPFVSKVTLMVKDIRWCSQARGIINKVVSYFVRLKMRSGGRGPLKRMSEGTGN